MREHAAMLAAFLLVLLVAVWPGWPEPRPAAQAQEPTPTLEVVVNEVAWAGTAASPRDEWIELRNNTPREIDLTGWTLVWGEDEAAVVIRFGAVADNTKEVRTTRVPARGFYLLERTDDETVRDVEADLIYTGALRNAGETLRLFDARGNLVDAVNLDGGEWPAGTAADPPEGLPPYATMERVDPFAEGTDANWATNDGVIRNGHDAQGNPINGTPKAENSQKKTQ